MECLTYYINLKRSISLPVGKFDETFFGEYALKEIKQNDTNVIFVNTFKMYMQPMTQSAEISDLVEKRQSKRK